MARFLGNLLDLLRYRLVPRGRCLVQRADESGALWGEQAAAGRFRDRPLDLAKSQ